MLTPSTESAGGAALADRRKPAGKKKLRDLLPSVHDRIAAIKHEWVAVTEEADLTDELRQLQELLLTAG